MVAFQSSFELISYYIL